MDIQGDMQITLVIKAPNQRMEDQTIDCMLGWTIRKLKHHLESVYPSKPKHHEQRLIYSGKLLQDHLTLKEVLKQYDTENTTNTHTVHLVCSNMSPSPSNSPPVSSTAHKAKEQSPQPAATSSPQFAGSAAPSSQADGLRHRGASQSQNVPPASSSFQSFPSQHPSSPIPPMGVPPTTAAGYQYTPEQYAWLVQQQQQAYSQYMMQQYMQYYQQSMYSGGQPFYGGGGMMPPMNPLNMPAAAAAATFLQQQAAPPPVVPQQPQQQPAAAPNNGAAPRGNNVQMNAQGGLEEEEDEERDPRDWLHHSYFIMRFITLVGIIVFYSSFSRFVMVMAGFLVIYFLQKMRVTREQQVRRQQQQQREQQQREEEQRQQQEQEQQQADNAASPSDQETREVQQEVETGTEERSQGEAPSTSDNGGDTTTTEPEPAAEPDQPDDARSKVVQSLYFVWKTVESFFSSLVPAPPELMEAN